MNGQEKSFLWARNEKKFESMKYNVSGRHSSLLISSPQKKMEHHAGLRPPSAKRCEVKYLAIDQDFLTALQQEDVSRIYIADPTDHVDKGLPD